MLLCRTLSLLLVCAFFHTACNTRTPEQKPLKAVDSTTIRRWLTSYDSLYTAYTRSKDPALLQSGGVYADSILQFEQSMIRDSALKKTFFFTLFNRAMDFHDLHNYIQSRVLLERYLTLYTLYGYPDPLSRAYAQKTLGNIYSRFGDYHKAILLLQKSLAYYTGQNDPTEQVSIMLNLSIALKELRQYAEAEKLLRQALAFPGVTDKRKGLSHTYLADICIQQGRINEAGEEIRKAKDGLNSITEAADRAQTLADLYTLEGTLLLQTNKSAEALATYKRALELARESSPHNNRNRETGKRCIAIGKAYEQLNQPDSALHFYNKALFCVTNADTLNIRWRPPQNELYAENTIAEALLARASCLVRTSQENQALEDAVECYRLALAVQKKLLGAFTYDESRLYLLEETRKQTAEAIGLCHRLYLQTKDEYWASQAFLFAEGNKAVVLEESIRRNIAASLFVKADSFYTAYVTTQENIAYLEIELNQQQAVTKPDTVLVRKLKEEKQQIEVALLQAENALKLNNPQYSNWLSNAEEPTADMIIRPFVSAGACLVEYFIEDSAAYCFTADGSKKIRFTRLAPGLQAAAGDFLSYFADRNAILNQPAEYAAAAYKLYSLLSLPHLPKANETMTIIPDSYTALIPFDALLTAPAASGSISNFPFLVNQAEISYAFSCRTVLIQQQHKSSQQGSGLICFAPVFEKKERSFTPLLYSKEELEGIRSVFPKGLFFSSKAATLPQFRSACRQASIIHLATHAAAGDDSAMAGIEFYDSTLYLNSIYRLPLASQLVVLSGCRTGAGNINSSEGLMSLARGFSYAGTRNVVAGLWHTEDKTSGDLFRDFYGALTSKTIAASLRTAKLSVLKNGSVAQSSPYYWAGYVFIGASVEKLDQPEDEGKPFVFLAAILFILGAVLLVAGKRSAG
ncbi:MAG TPA: CHAT domain-containing protein [Ferruginibacter sp.]|nr:CHAT domain-containing protein [Ferruginibacter sp.]